MEKKVIITIDSSKEDDYGEVEKMSFTTEGKLSGVVGAYEIMYQESELTGLAGTTTTLKAGKDSIILIRDGALGSMLVLEKGKTHQSTYRTEYGSLQIGVTARRVDVNMTDLGGELTADYLLDINGTGGGRSSIRIAVRGKQI